MLVNIEAPPSEENNFIQKLDPPLTIGGLLITFAYIKPFSNYEVSIWLLHGLSPVERTIPLEGQTPTSNY